MWMPLGSMIVKKEMGGALGYGARRHHAGDRRDADGLPVPARARPLPHHSPLRIRLVAAAVAVARCNARRVRALG